MNEFIFITEFRSEIAGGIYTNCCVKYENLAKALELFANVRQYEIRLVQNIFQFMWQHGMIFILLFIQSTNERQGRGKTRTNE